MNTNSIRVGGGKGKATILEVSHAKKWRTVADWVDPTAEKRAQETKEKQAQISRIREEIARYEVVN